MADPVPDGEGGTMNVQPKEVERSGTHFIEGFILRYADVPDDKEHRILRDNMRCNRMPLCVETFNGYKHTAEFKEDDCIVDDKGRVVLRGNDPPALPPALSDEGISRACSPRVAPH
jgi:hypothetical protein